MQQIKNRILPYIDPVLGDILRQGMRAYLFCKPEANPLRLIHNDAFDAYNNRPDSLDHSLPEHYHDLITQQQQIGWDNFFRGKYTKQWETCQQLWFDTLSPQLKEQHTHKGKIMSKMFKVILTTARDMWTGRNKYHHDRHTPSMLNDDYIEMERGIKQLWHYKDKSLEEDERFFPNDLDIHLENSIPHLRKWLQRWKPVILDSYQKATKIANSQMDMFQYVLRPHPKPKYKRVRRPTPAPPADRIQSLGR